MQVDSQFALCLAAVEYPGSSRLGCRSFRFDKGVVCQRDGFVVVFGYYI